MQFRLCAQIIGFILTMALSSLTCALPPTYETSSKHVGIRVKHESSNYFRFIAGAYRYRFFWDAGPTQVIIHSIQGLNAHGSRIIAEATAESSPMLDEVLTFRGRGKVRYASTEEFRVPDLFYMDKRIMHVAVEFSVVDGHMSIGPWLVMSADWENLFLVRDNLTLLLW